MGLAGPVWGLGAALFSYAVFAVSGAAAWGAIARVGAWLNLFNLLPIWQLDGGRGFRALSRVQAFTVAGLILALWFVTGEGLLVVLLLAAVFRARTTAREAEGDWVAFAQFSVLVVTLSVLCAIEIPLDLP